MNLQNISNTGRFVNLFIRTDEGLEIKQDKTFYPYYFEKDDNGKYNGYGGTSLRKVIMQDPRDIFKSASQFAWSSDIDYCKRYIIDKIDKIESSFFTYAMFDIEVKCKKLPDIQTSTDTVSCLSLYSSIDNCIKSWFLNDFSNELEMLLSFIDYLKQKQFDLFIAWNIKNFDYPYLYNRLLNYYDINFAKSISPINEQRYAWKNEFGQITYYPSGISILDYKGLYEKFTLNKRASYALDYISQEDLNERSWEDSNFNDVSKEILDKNINDVRRMVKLENKFGVLEYFSKIRELTKCLWEDLPQDVIKRENKLIKISNNIKPLEFLFYEEAKKQEIILPNKPFQKEENTFQGAFRETYMTGVKNNVNLWDLTSAYPSMILDFCIDSTNIVTERTDNTCKIDIKERIRQKNKEAIYKQSHTIFFEQNKNKLLPQVTAKLLTLKDKLKENLDNLKVDSKEYKIADIAYKAVKSQANSVFGSIGNKHFRLSNPNVVATIAFLVRDLLLYVEEQLSDKGYKIVFIDTDSVAIETKDDITDMLNNLIKDWGKKYNKENISVKFNYEGYFDKIMVLSDCHYYGYIVKPNGQRKKVVKGVEVIRSSSSKFESEFQENIIEKVLNGEQEQDILKWIESEKERIKTFPLDEIAFPFKIKNSYKNIPIYKRAYENAKIINKDFDMNGGEIGYYIFIKPKQWGYDEKPLDVIAFKKESVSEELNWDEIIRRNIFNKAERIFEVMGWGVEKLHNHNQLFLLFTN